MVEVLIHSCWSEEVVLVKLLATLMLGSGVREGDEAFEEEGFCNLLTQTQAKRVRTRPVLRKGIPTIMAKSEEDGQRWFLISSASSVVTTALPVKKEKKTFLINFESLKSIAW